MDKKFKTTFSSPQKWGPTIVLCVVFLVPVFGCAKNYSDEMMEPKAATAADLARAVIWFAKNNPAEAASLDDQELVRRATAFDPKLFSTYEGLVVRGTADGIILVCTGDGKRGLFEDAECTPKVDKPVWADSSIPCQFTLKTEAICP